MSIQATILENQAKEKLLELDYQTAYELLQAAISVDETENVSLFEQAINIAHEELNLFEDVINYATIVLAQDEHNTRVRLQRAWANYDLGKIEEALDDFQKVITESEESKDILYARSGRGLCYYNLSQYEQVVQDLEDAVVVYDQWAVGFAHLGWTYYFLKQYEVAKARLDTAIELSDDVYHFAHGGRGLVCYELNEYDTAIDDLSISLEDYKTWAQGFATRGWCYLDIKFYQNQLELALRDFSKAIELTEGDYSYAFGGRGIVNFEQKNYEEAIADLEKSLVDNRQWYRGYAVLGWALLEAGKYHEALVPLTYAIENSEDNKYSYASAGRGLVNFELSKLEDAKADLEIGLEENPTWIRGHAVYAWVLFEKANTQAEYKQALERFDSTLEVVDDYPFGYGGRGLVHYELKHYQQAVADLNKALPEDSEWARGYAVRAWAKYYLAETQEEYEDTLIDFNKAITFYEKESDHYALAGRGYVYFKLKKYQEAVADLSKATTKYKDWLSGYLFLADAYNKLGKTNETLKVYQIALDNVESKGAVYHERALFFEDINNYVEAVKDYQEALTDDKPKSWTYGSLAELYQRGLGVKQDYAEAFHLFQQAYDVQKKWDEGECFDATLINCYYQEIGVKKDDVKISAMIRDAVEKKVTDISFLLLMIYFSYNQLYSENYQATTLDFLKQAKEKERMNPWVLFYDFVLNKEGSKEEIIKSLSELDYQEYKAKEIEIELKSKQPRLLYPMYEKENKKEEK